MTWQKDITMRLLGGPADGRKVIVNSQADYIDLSYMKPTTTLLRVPFAPMEFARLRYKRLTGTNIFYKGEVSDGKL